MKQAQSQTTAYSRDLRAENIWERKKCRDRQTGREETYNGQTQKNGEYQTE